MSMGIGTARGVKALAIVLALLAGMVLRGQDTLAAIRQRGVLVAGTAAGYYPFEMLDRKHELVGFDADLAKALARDLGVKLEWRSQPFTGLIPALQSGRVDLVLAGMTATDERRRLVDFSVPYFTSGQALLVRRRLPGVAGWQDLDRPGRAVAVTRGTTADQTATRMFQRATVRRFDNSEQAGRALLAGKVQAVIHEVPWVAAFKRMHPDQTYAVLEPFTTEPLCIAVAKGQVQLLEYLDGFLARYSKGDEYARAYKHWFITMDWWDSEPRKH
jgi:polar amino acid transport system substrate-binding protein